MGGNETPMTGDSMRDFQTGLLATWLARLDGRDKATAKDKKLARIVAASAVDSILYYDQRRKRLEGRWTEQQDRVAA